MDLPTQPADHTTQRTYPPPAAPHHIPCYVFCTLTASTAPQLHATFRGQPHLPPAASAHASPPPRPWTPCTAAPPDDARPTPAPTPCTASETSLTAASTSISASHKTFQAGRPRTCAPLPAARACALTSCIMARKLLSALCWMWCPPSRAHISWKNPISHCRRGSMGTTLS